MVLLIPLVGVLVVVLLLRAGSRLAARQAAAEGAGPAGGPARGGRAGGRLVDRVRDRRAALPPLPPGHRPPPGLGPLSPSERFLTTEAARGLRELQTFLYERPA